jgi:hypothetical protein
VANSGRCQEGMKGEPRFTLKSGRWYACEFIGDEFDEDKCSYSPIRIKRVERIGDRTFRLHFYHANYPEGVRDKTYTLKTITRGKSFLLSKSVDHQPLRILQIYEINWTWVRRHFSGITQEDADIQEWLERTVV